MKIIILCYVLLFLLNVKSFAASDEFYTTEPNYSKWLVMADDLGCSLSHDILQYGNVIFVKRAGAKLEMNLKTINEPEEPPFSVEIYSRTPAWRKGTVGTRIIIADTKSEKDKLTIGEIASKMVLAELRNGNEPVFVYDDLSAFSLSPANFIDAYEDFAKCLNVIPSYGYYNLNNSVVFFAKEKDELTRETKIFLEHIVKYALLDNMLEKIIISGHSDSWGKKRYNNKISRKRAEAVSEYLKNRGVSGDVLEVQYFGEDKPKFDNKTLAGRKKNRRVSFEFIRKVGI